MIELEIYNRKYVVVFQKIEKTTYKKAHRLYSVFEDTLHGKCVLRDSLPEFVFDIYTQTGSTEKDVFSHELHYKLGNGDTHIQFGAGDIALALADEHGIDIWSK